MRVVKGKAVAFATMLLLVPLLVACGPQSIDVGLTSYAIAPSQDAMKAGDVTFHVANNATDQAHEFVIVSTDLAANSLPLDANGDVDETKLDIVNEVDGLQPGDHQDLSVNLPPGHYVLMCNQPGHYAQGMYLDFTVQ
jgi:uncharacterized cupredoxin-like copper-binding protein